MNNPIELFNELESFNVHDQECAKQKFAEAFASSKYQKNKYGNHFFLSSQKKDYLFITFIKK